MSRKKNQPAYHPVSKVEPGYMKIVHQVLSLPRLARIGIAVLFALAVTLTISPVVDTIYLTYLYTPKSVIAPAFVSTAFGLVMYFVGWQLIIGNVGEIPPARMMVLWYVGIGTVAIGVIVLWLITGVTSGNAPTF
jgi:hypothetical protein